MNSGAAMERELVLEETALGGSSPHPAGSPSLHRLIWRWHFFAGIFVAPVLFIVSITGAAYIFRSEIEDYAYAHMRFATPGSSRLGASALLEAGKTACPGKAPAGLVLPADPRRAAIVRFGEWIDTGQLIYVDPYSGVVLGSINPSEAGVSAFFDLVLLLHRQLFLGNAGRLIVELVVGWTIVLLVSGLYLWWPRRLRQVLGVWWPRWRAKPYTILRDLHSVTGVYLLAPTLVIVVTGLFYTLVWGEAFHQVTRTRGGGSAGAGREVHSVSTNGPRRLLSLNEIEVLARARYPGRDLSVSLKCQAGDAIELRASNDYNNTYGPYVTAQFRLDPFDGRLLSHTTLAEDERYWWHGWTYPLHVGSVLGPASKVLWLLACLVLCGLPITGLWMWLKRRPSGKAGFPRRPEMPLPRGLLAAIIALAIALPGVGLCMVLIVTGELFLRRVRPAR